MRERVPYLVIVVSVSVVLTAMAGARAGDVAASGIVRTTAVPQASTSGAIARIESRATGRLEGFAPNVRLGAVHFDFDKADIRPGDATVLDRNAAWIKARPEPVTIAVDGGADQRGPSAYNLALGERRAQAVKGYLVSRGVSADRIVVVSRGKDLPACRTAGETCWQRSRRVDFLVKGPGRQAP